jgi:serine/threonine-protein kinase
MENMQGLVGQTLGQYTIMEQIGEGGMASVFKAYQPGLDREVALKVLPPQFAKKGDFSERFAREAKAIGNLHHPNILPVYDSGQNKGYSYLAMRYIAGARTLGDEMKQPLTVGRIIELISQIAAALDHAHEAGVIHRDIKPSNVLMDGEWALLSDFGLAKMVEASVELTGAGVGMGTPAYMSPEQGRGQKVDRRTDIYALGIILFEMLTGQVPHKAETPIATVMKRLSEPLPLPRSLNPDIPEAVERVLLKALAVDPELRFERAGALAAALKEAYGDRADQVLADVSENYVIPDPKTATPPATGTAPEVQPVTHVESGKSGWPINIFGFGAIGLLILLVLCGIGVLIAFQLWPDRSPITWEYVLDLSAEMNEPFPGESSSKWASAQATLGEDLALAPEEINVGLRVFGQGEGPAACTETSLLVEPNPNQAARIQDRLEGLAPVGTDAPLTEALVQAFNDLELSPDKRNALIILTAGTDTCEPNGAAQIATLVQRLNVRVDTYIVGLAIAEPAIEANLQELANASQGVFLPVNSTDQLGDVLQLIQDNLEAERRPEAIAVAATPPPPPAPTPTEAVPVALAGQEAFELALTEAEAWQADAVLVEMQASALGPVDSEGKSEGWSLMFYSPAANETNSMIFLNGTLNATPLPNQGFPRAIPDFEAVNLDTKAIYDTAAAAGGSEQIANGANVTLALTTYPIDESVPTWYVTYSATAQTGGLIVIIDARSGEVLQTIEP